MSKKEKDATRRLFLGHGALITAIVFGLAAPLG